MSSPAVAGIRGTVHAFHHGVAMWLASPYILCNNRRVMAEHLFFFLSRVEMRRMPWRPHLAMYSTIFLGTSVGGW